ncbi:MAG TPA: hypothetical protein VI750_12895 [Pyrinomonadaceae bacterium]|nr:hypothetical protein [Pyrinomonadaceae bacterium]HLE64038.1 hypothetical protein [Pyrinomonadaceae bacterium]
MSGNKLESLTGGSGVHLFLVLCIAECESLIRLLKKIGYEAAAASEQSEESTA